MRLIDGAAPSITVPSIGTLSPGRTRNTSPTLTAASSTVSVLPSFRTRKRRLRRKIEQRADGAAGPLARAQLEHLAEQHQRDDDGGRLEIDRHQPVASCIAAGNRPGASVATRL